MAGPLGNDVYNAFTAFQNTDVDSGAAEQITATSTPASRGVQVKALANNSGTIYVGNSSSVSTSTGYPLAAGEAILLKVDNANKVWVIGSVDNQGVAVLVV